MSRKVQILIIVAVFAIGVAGYYLIEGNWSFLDALYMTIITISTIGYGEVKPLSTAGRIFTVFFIFLGLSTAAVLASQLARSFVEKNFRAIFEANKMRKKINRIKDHFIVCGFGDIGSSISSELYRAGIPFVIIENDERIAEFATMKGYLVVKGKATYDDTLIEAGVKRARGIVVCLGDDSLNMYVTLAARELNHDLLIIVRGYKSDGEQRMIRAGANSVVYPLRLGGQQMAQLIISEYSKNYKENKLEISTMAIMGYSLKLYRHYKNDETTVADILTSTNAVKAIKIRRADDTEVNDPGLDEVIKRDDSILLLIEEKETEEETLEDEVLKAREEILQRL